MSFVVRIVGHARLEPAEAPVNGMPSCARRRSGSISWSSHSVFSRRNVFPPPQNTASAFSTARRASGASWSESSWSPSSPNASRAFAA